MGLGLRECLKSLWKFNKKYISNYRIRNINLTRVKDTKRYEYVLENYVIIKPINIKSYKIETKTLVNLLSEDEINNNKFVLKANIENIT